MLSNKPKDKADKISNVKSCYYFQSHSFSTLEIDLILMTWDLAFLRWSETKDSISRFPIPCPLLLDLLSQ